MIFNGCRNCDIWAIAFSPAYGAIGASDFNQTVIL